MDDSEKMDQSDIGKGFHAEMRWGCQREYLKGNPRDDVESAAADLLEIVTTHEENVIDKVAKFVVISGKYVYHHLATGKQRRNFNIKVVGRYNIFKVHNIFEYKIDKLI